MDRWEWIVGGGGKSVFSMRLTDLGGGGRWSVES